MNKFVSLARAASFALLLTTSQYAAAAELGSAGKWTYEVVQTSVGEVCSVKTYMHDGGNMALFVTGTQVNLEVSNPDWTLTKGNTSHIRLNIDGTQFNGEAQAINETTLMIADVSDDFFDDFIKGDMMDANIGGVKWTISLEGSDDATDGMVECVKAIRALRVGA